MLIAENMSLAPKTTLHIGGPARYYTQPSTVDEVQQALRYCNRRKLPLLVLGRGSNLLVSDTGWPGLVLDLTEFGGSEWDGAAVRCFSGMRFSVLVKEAVDRGFQGMEELAGIPGTVGGGLVMNAGAFGQTISDCLEWVETIDPVTCLVERHELSALSFGYRSSSLAATGALICRACFRLTPGYGDAPRETYDRIMRKRKEKQPLDLPNCGSVFKRPPGDYAGRLIEECGLKGVRIGDAMVSPKHANFIVNMGAATAAQFRELVGVIQDRVHERFGVVLEPEVVFVGEFEKPLFNPPR
jgi:UDP-N-acetylmuramate dehydrogenase